MGYDHNLSDDATMGITEEHRTNSILLSSDQLSPSEVSQTESTEAIPEIAPLRSIIKPPRKPIAVANPVLPDMTSKSQTAEDIPDSSNIKQSSTDANVATIANTKKRSYKRPAPPPPVQTVKEKLEPQEDIAASSVDHVKTEGDCVDSEERLVRTDSEDESRLFDSKSDDSMSLVTEIFSYLKSNNEKEEVEVSKLPHEAPRLEKCIEEEDTLLYDQNYIMPGVQNNSVTEIDIIENEPDNDKVSKEQRALCDMFYNDMIANNYKFPIDDSDSQEQDSDDSDASEHKQGSYDFTHSDDSDSEEDDNDGGAVTLKSFAVNEEANVTTRNAYLTQLSNDLNGTAQCTNGSEHSTSDSEFNAKPEIQGTNLAAEKDELDSETMTETDSVCSSSSGYIAPVNTNGSYFSYGNLISPPGYRKGITGAKHSPLSPKPPLPPKPVFH